MAASPELNLCEVVPDKVAAVLNRVPFFDGIKKQGPNCEVIVLDVSLQVKQVSHLHVFNAGFDGNDLVCHFGSLRH